MNAPANFKLPTAPRERLVVIGNGMAGCRAVEEILARDPERYAITIFGAEPRVNYNRIMLSPVLAGEKTFDEIVIREDANPRGRRRGEVAEMLVQAIAGSERNGRKVDVVLDEMEAAREAISRAARNDLVILMADKPAAVFEQLTGRTS